MQQILLNNSEPVVVEAIIRTVPYQRIVVRGVWNEQAVFAKVFYGVRAKQHYLRDLSGVNYLAAAGILTPALLYKDESRVDSALAYVLIFSAIADAFNAEQLLATSCQQGRFDLAAKLVKAVAAHHQANLVQVDLYPKNFLVTTQHVYTIDGDGIRNHPKLGQKVAMQNLSLLLSKFDVLDLQYWFDDLLAIYAQARGWETFPHRAAVLRVTNAYRQKIASIYADKKVFRQCTDVNIHQQRHYFMAWSSGFANLTIPLETKQLDALIANAKWLKDGNTCTVALAKFDDTKVVIKRYNIKNVTHRLSRMFRQTRASISWANAHRLKLLGIATIQPISLLEERFFFGRLGRRSYFLSEYLDGLDADAFFAAERDKVKRAEAVKHIVELFYRLYLLNISHGDMKASNIKIVDNQPVLIDLDSMKQHRFGLIAKHRHARDLRRFMRNWQGNEALTNAFKKVFKVVYTDHQPLKLAHIN